MKFIVMILIFISALPVSAREGQRDEAREGLLGTMLGRKASQRIEVRSGETVTATIAVGQINRIVLPFERPEIRTLNPSTAEIQGHVLYIAPIDTGKIHLFVTDAGDVDQSIALSLTPEEIPPREIQLELAAETHLRAPSDQGIQPRGTMGVQEGQISADATRDLLKALAAGQIPEGYRFRPPGHGESIRCRQKHLLVQTRQVFDSGRSQVRVGVVRNSGKAPLLVEEESCSLGETIEAVATYPSGNIAPGQEVEIFVVVRQDIKEHARMRPTLITRQP